MKIFSTLLFTIIYTIAFSQDFIQLDSIFYEDLNEGTSFTTRFEYNIDNQLAEINGFFETVDVNITYNDNGDYLKWEAFEYGSLLIAYDFIYNIDNELDSMVGEQMQYGYLVKSIYDITEENDLITEVKFIEDYGGYEFVNSEKEINYDTDLNISKITEFDIFYYTGAPISTEDFVYEDGRLFTITYNNIEFPDDSFKDSIIYNIDGTTAQLTRLYPDNMNDPYDYVYMENEMYDPETFISPFDFYKFIFLVFGDTENPEFYTMLNNDRPAEHIFNGGGTLLRGTWFYSILTNNQETRIPAQSISVYPNPSADFVTIDLESAINKIDVYTITGDLVYSQKSDNKTLDIQSLAAGSYVIVVETKENGNYFSKISKH